jgi:twitching motility two-component system response regulator PilH
MRKAFDVNERNEIPRSILIVDDSTFLRKRVRQALQDQGYTLVEADSASSALKEIENQEFSCIVTDLVMPGMDGFGLLAEIQKRHVAAPVVVLTADVQKSTHDRCAELGAAAFLQKPVNAVLLRSVLTGIMGGR